MGTTKELVIQRTSRWHCDALAARMRKEDADEVLASSNHTPLQALINGFNNSHKCYTALYSDIPIVMFGVVKTNASMGTIWMLCSDLAQRQSIAVLRQAPKEIEKLHKVYPVLANYVDARNALHIKWIEHMGFGFIGESAKYGYAGLPFKGFASLATKYKELLKCADQQHS